MTKLIGRWCGDNAAADLGEFNQQLLRHRVRGATQTNRFLAAGNRLRNARGFFQNQRERSRPERVRKFLRDAWYFHCPCIEFRPARNVHDQRVVRRSAFGHENFCDCLIVCSVRTKAINRLGW